MLVCLQVQHFWGCIHFLYSFTLFSSGCIISISFQSLLVLSSANADLLLDLCSELSFLGFVLFNARFPLVLFNIFLVISCLWIIFFMLSFNSLTWFPSFFEHIYNPCLKVFTYLIQHLRLLQGASIAFFFFPMYQPHFPVALCSSEFFVENWPFR